MRRRDFLAALAASALLATSKGRSQVPVQHPRLLISGTDPFTGLALLRTRYASGMRPSQDMEGWALSWLLTRQESFAEQALAAMTMSAGRWRSIGSQVIQDLSQPLRIGSRMNSWKARR